MKKHIDVSKDTKAVKVPVRKYRTRGPATKTVAISLPNELSDKIDSVVEKKGVTRSRLISDIVEKGLSHE